jgi:hypothetical protein
MNVSARIATATAAPPIDGANRHRVRDVVALACTV